MWPQLLLGVTLGICVASAASVASSPLVDTHVHLTNLTLLDYPWLDNSALLNHTWTLANYTSAISGSDFVTQRVVFVEAAVKEGEWEDEVRYIQSLADAPSPRGQPTIGAIVGSAPLEQGVANTTAWLQRLKRAAPLLRGIRRGLPTVLPNATCNETLGAYLAAVHVLGQEDLHCELVLPQDSTTLGCAIYMIKQAPKTRFIINHMGSPDIKSGNSGPWQEALDLLGPLPNVVMKFSGMPNEAGDGWTKAKLQPYFNLVWDAFGPDRMLFGGNWFVVNVHANFSSWAQAAMSMLSRGTDSERAQVMGGNAVKFYRISDM